MYKLEKCFNCDTEILVNHKIESITFSLNYPGKYSKDLTLNINSLKALIAELKQGEIL